MSRLINGSIVLVVVGGVIVAMVAAQDQPQAPADSAQPASSSAAADTNSAGLANQLSSVGRSLALEYGPGTAAGTSTPPDLDLPLNTPSSEPAVLLAADQSTQAGGLRSVLKRSPNVPTTSTPPSRRTVQEPKALSSASDAAPETPKPETAVPSTPPPTTIAPVAAAPATTTPSTPVRPDSARVSSRRTFRSDVPSTRPTIVASKPVSSRRAGTPAYAPGKPSGEALASSVGALLRVDTIGPQAVTLGEQNEYVIRLSNAGVTEARNATVRVAIPSNVQVVSTKVSDGNDNIRQDAKTERQLIWSLERVPARAERQLTLTLIPTENRPFDLAVEWATLPVSSTATVDVRQPMLEIALSGPNKIDYGQTKVYSIVLSNPGTGDAKNVTVRLAMGDESADAVQVGTLPAGGNQKFDVEVTARKAGAMRIAATAVGANNLQAEAVEQIVVQRANLQLEALGSARKFAGSIGTYQVRLTNVGDAAAGNVQAAVRLGTGAKYVKGIEGAKQEANLVRWNVGELAPNTERIYRFFCELDADGDAVFQFVASADGGLQATGDVVTKVEALADLKLEVNDPKGPIPVGEEVTYEIQITNRGTKAAVQVQVVAQFSEGIEPVAAGGMRAEMLAGQVVFQPISRIGAGEITKLTVKARADAEGNHVFRTEVKCVEPVTKLVAEDTTRFFGEDSLTGSKPPAVASPGVTEAGPRVGTKPLWFGSGQNE